jgi:glutamate racemase
VKPAVKSTKTGVIGVLATAGTLKADKYLNTREKFSDGIKIVEHIGQGFVELVEKGCLTGNEAESTVAESLKPLLNEGADRIVLGCTHYPFLADTISKVASTLYPEREIEIIDPAPAVARHLMDIMKTEALIHNEGFSIELYTSGDASILKDTFYRLG